MSSTDCDGALQEANLEFFERELASFVPDRVFDAHAHLWRENYRMPKPVPGFPVKATWDDYVRLVNWLLPGREVGAWVMPKPVPYEDPEENLRDSEWVAEQVAGQPFARGAFVVRPGDDPELVRQHLKRLGLCGYKCYHFFAGRELTFEADVEEYLSEPLVAVADQEGWVITLHMVKSRAVADPGNIEWIRHCCKSYPNMKLILAHSARGFQPSHNFAGLPQLMGFDNLYFDCSANCEPLAHESIIRLMGHKKLMYGMDFGYASHGPGRSVAVADTFLWLYDDSPVWEEKHTKIRPVSIALESLRSLKWACWSARLSDSQVEDIFWNNASELFGLE